MGLKNSKEENLDSMGDMNIEEGTNTGKMIPSIKIDRTNFAINNDRESRIKSVFYDSKNNSISGERTIEIDTPSKKIIENIIDQEFHTLDSKSSNSFSQQTQDALDNFFWSQIPLSSSYKVVEFLIDDLDILLTVSKKWSKKINKILKLRLARVNNTFYKIYRKRIEKATRGLSLRKIKQQKIPSWKSDSRRTKTRFDLVIRAKLGAKLRGRRVMISYKYRLKSRKDKELFSNYVFDVHGEKKSRVLWIMKEERRRSETGQVMDYIPIQPLNVGDWIQIGINIWSPEGLVDLDSITWQPMRLGDAYNPSKFFENPKRDDPILCPLEYKIYWTSVPRDPREVLLPENFLSPCFERMNFKSSGLEAVNVKAIFKAVKKGVIKIKNSRSRKSDLKITVIGGTKCMVNINRVGLMDEFGNSLSFKIGDILVFYLSLV